MPYDVLHLLGTAQPEGASIARIVGSLGRRLDPEKYELHAWFLQGRGPLADELERAGMQVRVFEWSGPSDLFGNWRLWRRLRGRAFAIVHQHLLGRGLRWLVRGATRAKIIAHVHSHVEEARSLSPTPILTTGADLVIASSQAVAEWVQGSPTRVVYPGVCVPTASGASAPPLGKRTGNVLGTAGRLVPMKGIVYLIRAFAHLRTEFPQLRLEIAGLGSEQAVLEREVRTLGVQDGVTFLGWRADLAPVLAGWDIYVQPSVVEPFGLAALEAMAAGLPVVATTAGGLTELVEDGRTGWLVSAGNPQGLAGRIRELLLDPMQRRAMGEAGHVRARERFSSDRMAAEISEIYESLLAA